jgi:hypothetical protein
MSCEVSSTSSANQVYSQNTQPASAPPQPQTQQQSDSVSLSQQAQTSLAADHG